MNATELNATNVIKTSSQTENQNVAVEDGNSHSSTVNVSAAYSYLGVLTSEQGSLCEELSLAQSTLQRHIATLATDPQRAQNANQVPNDKPLLDLTTRVILRDIDLQEQIANDLTSRVEVVKTADAVDKLRSYCDTLPRIFQESNEPGKALMRYLCELVVNKTTADNISPATSRQLAVEQIFPPEVDLSPKAEQIINKLIRATVEFIRANQPDVIASMGREGGQVILPSSTRAKMAEFIELAVSDIPDDFTYLDIFANKNNNFDDETSEVIAKRVGDIINRAANTAREAHLLDDSVSTTDDLESTKVSDQSPMDITVRELSKRSSEVQKNIADEQSIQEKKKITKKESIESLARQILDESKDVIKTTDYDSQEDVSSSVNVSSDKNSNNTTINKSTIVDKSLLNDAVLKSLETAIANQDNVTENYVQTPNNLENQMGSDMTADTGITNIDLIDEYNNFSLPVSKQQGAPLDEGDEERIKYILSTAVAAAQQSNLFDDAAQKANAQVQPVISRAVEQTMKNVLLDNTIKVDTLKPNEAIVIEDTDAIIPNESSAPKVLASDLVHVEEPEIMQPELLTDETSQTVLPNVNLEDDIEISHGGKKLGSSALNVSIFAGDKSLGGADIVTRIVTDIDPNDSKNSNALYSNLEKVAQQELVKNAFPTTPSKEVTNNTNDIVDDFSAQTAHIPDSISLDDSLNTNVGDVNKEANFKPYFVGDYQNSAYINSENNQEVLAAEDSLSPEFFQITSQAESMIKVSNDVNDIDDDGIMKVRNDFAVNSDKTLQGGKNLEEVAKKELNQTPNNTNSNLNLATDKSASMVNVEYSSSSWVKGISKNSTLQENVSEDVDKIGNIANTDAVSLGTQKEEKNSIFGKISKFFGNKTSATEKSGVQSKDITNIELKSLSMDDMLRSLSQVINDGKVTPEIKKMAASIHQAMTNPLGDLQSVAEWLGFVNAPLSATGARAQAMQQWALMLLSIRFKQLGKNIDKFKQTDKFKQILQNASLGNDKTWPQNSLNQTLQQIERLQNLNSVTSDFPLPSYIPLPPSFEGGREGALMVEHQKNGDDAIEWRLNFFFELSELGPMQIRTSLKVPDLKINVVTEKLNAMQKVKETMDTLSERLSNYGFNVSPISARIGTVYPPISKNESSSNSGNVNNDGLSLNI